MRHKAILCLFILLLTFVSDGFLLGIEKGTSTLILVNGDIGLQEPFVSRLVFLLASRFNETSVIVHLDKFSQSVLDLMAYNRIIYYGLDYRVSSLSMDLVNKINAWLKGGSSKIFLWIGYNGHRFDFEQWGFTVEEENKMHTGRLYYYGRDDRLIVFKIGNPDVFFVNILNPEQVKVEALIETNDGIKPIIVRGRALNDSWGRVIYIGYHPTAYVDKLSGLIPFTDLLHEVYVYPHNKKLLFLRLEDWHPLSDNSKFKSVVDYLVNQKFYYTLSLIPAYAQGDKILETIRTENIKENLYHLLKAPYASVVIHGYTHQLNGTTAIDYEFYDEKKDVYLSVEQTRKRVEKAIELVFGANLAGFIAGWETPHYKASPEAYQKVFEKEFTFIFEDCHQDSLCWYLPYYLKINKTGYLNTILGYVRQPLEEIINEIIVYAEILSNLRYAVEIGLFYHPDVFGLDYLPQLIEALKTQGWESISLFTLLNY